MNAHYRLSWPGPLGTLISRAKRPDRWPAPSPRHLCCKLEPLFAAFSGSALLGVSPQRATGLGRGAMV